MLRVATAILASTGRGSPAETRERLTAARIARGTGSVLRRWGVNIPDSDERSACLKKYALEHLGGRAEELLRVYLGR